MMDKNAIKKLILDRNIKDLFLSHGWDHSEDTTFEFKVKKDKTVEGRLLCIKKRFAIIECDVDEYVDTSILTKIALETKKKYYEHILIIHSTNRLGVQEQIWCVSIWQNNKQQKNVFVRWDRRQTIDVLYEKLKGLVFPLDTESDLTLSKVIDKVRCAFDKNVKSVTKQFYEDFKKQSNDFKSSIEGMPEEQKAYYSTVMLNRLMFLYFIQKKGFLDGDYDYLTKKLEFVVEKYGNDKFDNVFYKHFLKVLFHSGLNVKRLERDEQTTDIIGNVPYLNGGIFEKNNIEMVNENINIKDKAFKIIFEFFKSYDWYIDRTNLDGKRDINPDILGHIFEKYITSRASEGAYYTQSDLTAYIANNTILPALMNKTQLQCEQDFTKDKIWRLLASNPDDYMYEAASHGIKGEGFYEKIPKEVYLAYSSIQEYGELRTDILNRPATSEFGNPKETWRDVLARRRHYEKIHRYFKLNDNVDILKIIKLNLNLNAIVMDILQLYDNHYFIEVFFKNLAGVKYEWHIHGHGYQKGLSILDPACGSGAFLLSALDLLEELYTICIDRMQEYFDQIINDEAAQGIFSVQYIKYISGVKNKKHWIYKNIILENLYGVDKMADAVETAKLRLFLKLAAQSEFSATEDNFGIDILPDIQFNVLPGNSLVGFANLKHFEQEIAKKLNLKNNAIVKIREMADEIGKLYREFIEEQASMNKRYTEIKLELMTKLRNLNLELDKYLCPTKVSEASDVTSFEEWKSINQPFHWLAHFYEIIENNKGFDVILGNPPYVVTNSKFEYSLDGYRTKECNNLYANFIERSVTLGKRELGMVVQLPLLCTKAMKTAQEMILQHKLLTASFAFRPGKLFEGSVNVRVCVFFLYGDNDIDNNGYDVASTQYNRWYSSERSNLFQKLIYSEHDSSIEYLNAIPKLGSDLDREIYNKLHRVKSKLEKNRSGSNVIYYHDSPEYFFHSQLMPSFYRGPGGEDRSPRIMNLYFQTPSIAIAASSLLNSTLFYWYFITKCNCRRLNDHEINDFPIDLKSLCDLYGKRLETIYGKLMDNYQQHKKRVFRNKGQVELDQYYAIYAKNIIDQIDEVLADYYNLSREEADYIINFDHKFRMGTFTRNKEE